MSVPDGPARPLVRLRRPAELAAAAPYLVGFHLAESVLAATVRRPSGQVGLLARTDLPAPEEESSRAELIARYVASENVDAAFLLVHTDEPDDPAARPVDGRARRGLVQEVRRAFADRGISVFEALLIRGDRWASYLCADPGCCPAEGTPVDADVDHLAAAQALTGRVVLNSRADLARSIDPVGGAASHAVGAAIDRTLSRLRRSVQGGVDGHERAADVVRAELDSREAEWRGGAPRAGPMLEPDRLADLVVALTDVTARDLALARCVGPHAEAFEPLWQELVRRTPAPLDAAPATLLAVSAYARGDGAFARVCIDRALSSHPGYSLAELIGTALVRAVPPRMVAGAIRAGAVPVRGP